MLKQWLFENAYGIVTTLLGGSGIAAFFFERKKRIAQNKIDLATAKHQEANALETIQLVYDKFVKDSLDRYADLKSQMDSIRLELEEVYKQLAAVTEELNEEKKRSKSLKMSYENLKKTCEDFTNNTNNKKKF